LRLPAFAKDVAAVYCATAVNGILGLAVVPIGLHFLGVSGYGLFSIYQLVYSYTTLPESGFTKNLVARLASAPAPAERIELVRSALSFYAFLSGIYLLGLPLLVIVIPDVLAIPTGSVSTARWIVALTVIEYVVGIPASVVLWYGNSQQRFLAISQFNIASGLFRYALVYVGIIVFRTPEAVVFLCVLRRVADFFLVRRMVGDVPSGAWRPASSWRPIAVMLRDSIPLTLVQAGTTTVYGLPAVVASRQFGLETLGAYRAVYDVGNRVWFFSGGLGVVAYPKLVRLFAAGTDFSTRVSLRSAFAASWSFYCGVCLVGVVGATWVSMTWQGFVSRFVLFATVLFGVSMSAHGQLAYELLQARRRYGRLLAAGALAVGAMMAPALLTRGLGPNTLGYGWVLSQLVYTTCVDHSALSAIDAGRRYQARFLLLKLMFCVAILLAIVAWRPDISASGYYGVQMAIVGGLYYLVAPEWRAAIAACSTGGKSSQSSSDGSRVGSVNADDPRAGTC